jgi:hypothetical protein
MLNEKQIVLNGLTQIYSKYNEIINYDKHFWVIKRAK